MSCQTSNLFRKGLKSHLFDYVGEKKAAKLVFVLFWRKGLDHSSPFAAVLKVLTVYF